jgi:hypothetical protein
MICKVTTPLFWLLTQVAFFANEVGPGQAQTGGVGKLLVELRPCQNVVDYQLPVSPAAMKE